MTKLTVRITYTIVAATLGLALSSSFITSALAASPHFIGTPTCTPSSSGSTKTLTCSGKVAGLGKVSTVQGQLVADVTTQCTTSSGANQPPGQARTVLGQPTTLTVSNGQTTFTNLRLSATANCPDHMTGSVTFTNVRVLVDGTSLLITAGPIDP
jgi:hypothetical protein